jgi:hypothetical protein
MAQSLHARFDKLMPTKTEHWIETNWSKSAKTIPSVSLPGALEAPCRGADR